MKMSETEEIWKNIIDYPLYEVSNMGNIRSLPQIKIIYRPDIDKNYLAEYKMKILKPSITQDGYLSVKLYNKKGFSTKMVHRIVADAFTENNLNRPTVNHINGIKTDNKISNLEWSTSKEQTEHANKYNLVAEHLKMKSILVYDSEWNFIGQYPSMKDAERSLGVLQARISEICRGIRKTNCNGYFFEYDNSKIL